MGVGCGIMLALATGAGAVEFPGPNPGKASASIEKNVLTLSNAVLSVTWSAEGGHLRPLGLAERLDGKEVRADQTGAELFRLPSLHSAASDFLLVDRPILSRIAAAPGAARAAEAIPGMAIQAKLQKTSSPGMTVYWRAELRDGSNYVRQTIEFSVNPSPEARAIPLSAIEMLDVRMPGAATVGTCPGSPVAAKHFFWGVEMPGARNTITPEGARIGFDCKLEITPAQSYRFSNVVGVAPAGQLRRAFLYYIERERARASSPFLHYNCWYDFAEAVNEKDFSQAVEAFYQKLTVQRGVKLDSYVIDDGWDNFNEGLWQTDTKKFPSGFTPLKKALDRAGSHLGIWISPLGGYGGATERTKHARKMGLIPEKSGLDLSQPGYHAWFEKRCLQLMRESGVNYFKWDKAGEGVSPHFMALLGVARALRKENPSLFINVTVGTWPSPFWLNHIDATWRHGSADVEWTGKGDDREKWLTYRDGYCRKLFVQAAPLYPINSVMHHGIVYGRHYQGERVAKAGPKMKNEVRSYFGNGAMLQELYLAPSMMTEEAWDSVAESARWARANADVLVDSHWVGGDPLQLEPYGYASWSPRKGTLTLRNPSDEPRTIVLDAAVVFELPPGAAQRYSLISPYGDQRVREFALVAGKPEKLQMQPFEVLVFDATPVK